LAGLTILAVVSCGTANVTPACEDLCTSPEFREAFLEGQLGLIIDYTSPGAQLIAMRNRALPCLQAIAEQGGDVFGIETCIEGPYGCEGWALAAIRLIGTPEARAYLVSNLDEAKEQYLLRLSIRAVGNLREATARPALMKLLKHQDPEIRTASIVSLGAIGDVADFDAMLEATLLLPDEQLYDAAHGFRILGDPRAFDALKGRVDTIEAPETRRSVEGVLNGWRSQIANQERLLETLRTGTGRSLIEGIRKVRPPVADDIRAALLELLKHEDPLTRAESVVALGKMHRESDFDLLLRTTLALPEPYVPGAAIGLVFLNDPRAIAPLEEYASTMKNMQRQSQVRQLAERLRRSAEGMATEAESD